MTLLLTARFEYDHKTDPPSSYHVDLTKKAHAHLEEKKDRGPALLLYHNIYMAVHYESRWLKCNKAEAERYSTADGSPPRIYVNLYAPEHQ